MPRGSGGDSDVSSEAAATAEGGSGGALGHVLID
eukprot:COSAG06_NODE_71424_length_184_cov_27.823529_1_plen_33_part_01